MKTQSRFDKIQFGVRFWFIVVLIVLFCFIVGRASAEGIDGKFYFGIFDTETLRAQPDGDTFAKFITGVEFGYTFERVNLRPYILLETLMDEYNKGSRTFHPASIDYTVGIEWNFFKDLHLIGEHSCWHPIDSGGTVEVYNLLKIEYRF